MEETERPRILQPNELSPAVDLVNKALEQLDRILLGRSDLHRIVFVAVLSRGHVLLEGVPGVGKTALVKALGQILGLDFKRVQFTPDLMPGDILGTHILQEGANGKREMSFHPGPVFTNLLLADEINRASPKTQSALLEAMQEQAVTLLGTTRRLPDPFFVLASQNPIELEGTYPLPEAQLDRFLFKLIVESPSGAELKQILQRTTTEIRPEVTTVFTAEAGERAIADMRQLVRQVLIAPPLEDYVVSLIGATTPNGAGSIPAVKTYVRFGPGPRAAQAVVLGAKVNALLDGRAHASFEDITDVVLPALRHRLILNFQAEAENVTTDSLIGEVLRSLRRP